MIQLQSLHYFSCNKGTIICCFNRKIIIDCDFPDKFIMLPYKTAPHPNRRFKNIGSDLKRSSIQLKCSESCVKMGGIIVSVKLELMRGYR